MKEVLKQHILKNGTVLGLILVAITLTTYLLGAEYATNYIISFGTLLVSIIYPIYHTRKLRTSQGGFISFKDAFTSCTGILIAAGFINIFVSIVLYNIIDPGYAMEMIDAVVNKTVAQFEQLGMDDAQIEEMIKQIEESTDFSPLALLKSYIFSIIFYTVFGLVVAAFTKKEEPIID